MGRIVGAMPLFGKPDKREAKARLPLCNFAVPDVLPWGAATPGTPLSGRVGVKMRGWKEGHLQKRVAAEHYRKDQNAVDTARVRRVEKLTEMHRTQSNPPPRSRSVHAGLTAGSPLGSNAPPLGKVPSLEAPSLSLKASS